MERLLFRELVEWKDSKDRKPLLLDGVRQCGKTHLLKELGSREFKDSVYCNFEESPMLKEVFADSLDPKRIVRDLDLLLNVKIQPGRTLLILDEIQECDTAITSLKYFAEHMPELHVACAGSLLGVKMSEASFPVGKVDTKHLYPMSFCEFLMAEGETSLAEFILSDPLPSDISKPIHDSILRLLRDYCVVGGMPAVVDSWRTHHDITKVDSLQKELLDNYAKDFGKHGGYMTETIMSVWSSFPAFLSRENRRFRFKELKNDGRADDFRDPVQWLTDAHLVYKVNQTKGHAFPPSTEENDSLYKLYACDVGLLRAMSGHPAGMMLTEDDDTRLYKGGMYENLVVCEMMSSGSGRLFYWRDGNYEVDLIAALGGRTVPIEVKSGTNFKTESLNRYQRECDEEYAVIVSMNMPQTGKRLRIPFYMVCNLPRYEGVGSDPPIDVSGMPYEHVFSDDDWVKDADGFSLTIPASRHRRGRIPQCVVQRKDGGVWIDTSAGMELSDAGDITIHTDQRFAGRAVVRNRPMDNRLI